jgi:hypothetical protein
MDGKLAIPDGQGYPPKLAPARALSFDGFISYQHDTRQADIARALQRALHQFAKPWYRLRAVRLYRDETSQAAHPDLWSVIVQALPSLAIPLRTALDPIQPVRFLQSGRLTFPVIGRQKRAALEAVRLRRG